MIKLSVVLPIFNEEQSLEDLYSKLSEFIVHEHNEIIAVNDGSKDNSLEVLKKIAEKDKKFRIIDLKINSGQTAAINAGIKNSKGEIIVLIDSDLENDPADIPKLLKKLDEGYDVVSGWRKNRWKGNFLMRKLPSMLANRLISKVSGVRLNDYGCTLKAYKKNVIQDVHLYGEMHRFIPVFCSWQGGKVAEVEVSYKQRKYGKSNYGIARTYKVILDLILIRYMHKYLHKPIHFFGGFGFISFALSFIVFMWAVYYKVIGGKDFVQTPLPILSGVFFIVGFLMILMGIIAEVLMRTYYETQNKLPYHIKQKINF